MENPETLLPIEVAYAKPREQIVIPLQVPAGTTVHDALEQSGLARRFPEIDLEQGKFGIFSKQVKADTEVRAGDRVEIYRPLIADPKAARKKRAAAQKQGSA